MKKNLGVLLIFVLIIVIFTCPLFFKINTCIPGSPTTDETFIALWDSWRIQFSFQHRMPLRNTDVISYPFGVDLYSSGYFSYLWLAIVYLLSIFTNPVLTYNVQILFNFFLCALATYMLVFYLTKNNLCAIFSGIIFAFCPYQFARIWQHLGLSINQWLTLSLLSVILLKEINSRKIMFIFLLSIILLLSFDYSVMYMGSIMLASFTLYVFSYHWKVKFFNQNDILASDFKYLKKLIISVLLVLAILLSQILPVIKNRLKLSSTTTASAFNYFHRPFEDLFSQSIRPLSLFLPATVHPVFGKFTEQFIGSSLYGVSLTEHTVYLGWVPLILAFLAVKRWKRNRKRVPALPAGRQEHKNTRAQEQEKEDFYIGFFVFLTIVAWLFSQPPWWQFGPLKIYMPSSFMYKILPMFRAYCRFAIVIMLAVAVLAGFGLKFYVERFRSRKTRVLVAIICCSLVLFEFWNWPPYKVIDVSKVPQAYYWLKEQPDDFVIAEYPLDYKSPNQMYEFYQTKHEKKIINGTIPGSYANKVAQSIKKLSDLNTPEVLKWMGVKYVLAHHEDYLKTDFIEDKEELEKIPKNPGLKLISSFPRQECPNKDIMCVQKTGPIDVYEVIAAPLEPKIKD